MRHAPARVAIAIAIRIRNTAIRDTWHWQCRGSVSASEESCLFGKMVPCHQPSELLPSAIFWKLLPKLLFINC